jgi:hypothetical protein
VMLAFALGLVLAAFWLVYRSGLPLIWIALALLTSVAAALLAARWLIGSINVISMAFASILIGISIDYSILVYHHFASGEPLGNVRWKILTKGVWFSAFTTAMAFGVLYFSSFPGLRQLAILVAVGLLASAAFATNFLALVLDRRRPRQPPRLHRAALWWGHWLGKRSGSVCALALATLAAGAALLSVSKRGNFYNPDVAALQPSNLHAYEAQRILQSQMPAMKFREAREENRKLWPLGSGEHLKTVAKAAGIGPGLLQTTLLLVERLDLWKRGEASLSTGAPGEAEMTMLYIGLHSFADRGDGGLYDSHAVGIGARKGRSTVRVSRVDDPHLPNRSGIHDWVYRPGA